MATEHSRIISGNGKNGRGAPATYPAGVSAGSNNFDVRSGSSLSTDEIKQEANWRNVTRKPGEELVATRGEYAGLPMSFVSRSKAARVASEDAKGVNAAMKAHKKLVCKLADDLGLEIDEVEACMKEWGRSGVRVYKVDYGELRESVSSFVYGRREDDKDTVGAVNRRTEYMAEVEAGMHVENGGIGGEIIDKQRNVRPAGDFGAMKAVNHEVEMQ